MLAFAYVLHYRHEGTRQMRGEVAPTDHLYAPTPPPPCDCDQYHFNCEDFSTHGEAQACFDHCWAQAGCDIHHLDSDGVACEPTLSPGTE
jgi:hypothetical protein